MKKIRKRNRRQKPAVKASFTAKLRAALSALLGVGLASLAVVAAGFALIVAAVSWFLLTTPDAKDLDQCITAQMFKVPLCPRSSAYVRLGGISKHMQNAILVAEDGSFYDHDGIDWVELKSSFETNLARRRFARGGSTITQQLAKNVYLTADKTLIRKLREALIAIRIEKLYGKTLILEKYLNVVEFGPRIFGIKAAAATYFKKSPAQLDLAEAAWLAMLLPNPEKYGVSFRTQKMTPFAVRRMSQILDRILARGKADPLETDLAKEKVKSLFGAPAPPPALDVISENLGGVEPESESEPTETEGSARELEEELENWEE